MSAIGGILNLDGAPVDVRDLDRMSAAMERRGPDGGGSWVRDNVGLVHRVLASTPEAHEERLPRELGPLALTADARLDNRDELIDALGLEPGPDELIGDGEIILHAYARWQESCLDHLRGDFAFAVWSSANHRLFCARDHFGVRPFYYYRSDARFAFASEVGALLSLDWVPRRLDEARIGDFLVPALEGVDEVCTFYQGILRLPPAHTASVAEQGTRTQRYWTLTPPAELHLGSDAEYCEAFLEVFTHAVRTRLGGQAPRGSMLSGGLDSSSIVAVARKLLQDASEPLLHTFSAVAADPTCVETRCANAVIAQGGVHAHTVQPDDLASHLGSLREVLAATHDPFDLTIAHVPLTMYSAARQVGCKSLLDGVPGDLVVSLGAGYLGYLMRMGAVSTVCQEAFGARRFYGIEADAPLWALLHGARAALTPAWVRALRRQLSHSRRSRELIGSSIIKAAFAHDAGVKERLSGMMLRGGANALQAPSWAQARTLRQPWMTVGLERYGRVAASLGLEARHPFLDRRLVELCLSLPWSQKISRGRLKIIVRRAMKETLPAEVIWRRRDTHVGPLFTEAWIRLNQERIGDILGDAHGRFAYYVDVAAVRKAFRGVMAGSGSEQDLQHVWQALVLGEWLDRADSFGQTRLAPPLAPYYHRPRTTRRSAHVTRF